MSEALQKLTAATKLPYGYELSIWDSKASDFSSGLEYTQVFRYVHGNALLTTAKTFRIWTGLQRQIFSPYWRLARLTRLS